MHNGPNPQQAKTQRQACLTPPANALALRSGAGGKSLKYPVAAIRVKDHAGHNVEAEVEGKPGQDEVAGWRSLHWPAGCAGKACGGKSPWMLMHAES